MADAGDPVSLDDAAVLVNQPHSARGVTYRRVRDSLIEPARAEVLDLLGPVGRRPSRLRVPCVGALGRLGAEVARQIDGGTPEEVLLSRNDAVGYHYDQTGPDDTTPAVVFLRDGMDGGEAILPGRNLGFAAADGWLLAFDSRTILHGVAPMTPTLPDGYRVALVFYVPANQPLRA